MFANIAIGWLKDVAFENMSTMEITDCKFVKLRGWLKLIALSNIESMVVTLSVCNVTSSLNDVAP